MNNPRWPRQSAGPNGRFCCGSTETSEVRTPSRCPIGAGAVGPISASGPGRIEKSRLKLRKWVFAIYLEATSLKGVSSMKLHRDLDVTQKTANRIRESFAFAAGPPFDGPVEADETAIGGLRKNMPKHKRAALKGAGTGYAGKSIVADRATNPPPRSSPIRDFHPAPFVESRTKPDATVYTDEHSAYLGLRRPHEAVRIESFWSTLKRAHKGVYHKISPKHLQRSQFAGRRHARPDAGGGSGWRESG